MKKSTIMAAIIATIIVVAGGGFAIGNYLENRPVVFNDPALEQAVRTNIGISDRPITHKEAEKYVSLDLPSSTWNFSTLMAIRSPTSAPSNALKSSMFWTFAITRFQISAAFLP